MAEWPLVSVIIVAWNSRADLARCLPSLVAQEYPHVEIIVVDNASTDDLWPWIALEFPAVRFLRNSRNVGFAAATNQGFQAAQGEVLVALNPDTTVAPDWLFPLVTALQQPGVGLVTARLMLMETPTLVNACGNEISLTGLTFCRGAGEPGTHFHGTHPVPAISGAACALTRVCYEALGGFDPDYFTYFEDTDLSWRARLAGLEVVLAADAVVYHDYQFRFHAQKMYWIERNRYLTLFKHLRVSTLVRLLPALLLGEVIAWGYAFLRGPATLHAKARAMLWLCVHLSHIRQRRAAVQALRRVEDNALITVMSPTIRVDHTWPGRIGRWLNRLLGWPLHWWQQWMLHPRSSGSSH